MLVHSTASHSLTIGKERRIESLNGRSSLDRKQGISIGGSDWNKTMPTSKSQEDDIYKATSSSLCAEQGRDSSLNKQHNASESQSADEEYLKTPKIHQKIPYEITSVDVKVNEDNDCNDEDDVPELISEDDCIIETTAALRLDMLQRELGSSCSSPIPSAPLFSAQTTPSISILKKQPSAIAILQKKKGSTPRRIRGLWDVNIITYDGEFDGTTDDMKILMNTITKKKQTNSNIFSQLRDETITHCLSFLAGEPLDLLAVSQVGRRFHSLVTTSLPLWKTVHATNFVHQQFKHHSNGCGETTTKALAKLLLKYPPETLIIRDIGHKLHADYFSLPPAGRLKNLTLTHFKELTDTHVHVLLLLLALPSSKKQQQQKQQKKLVSQVSSSLLHLSLEYCPKLTNATIRSIASSSSCVELQSLSIRGDSGISDLMPIAKLLQIKPGTTMLPTTTPLRSTTSYKKLTVSSNPLANLFGGPPPAPKPRASPALGGLNSLFAPPPAAPKASNPAAGLNSLFALPPSANPAAGSNFLLAPPPTATTAKLAAELNSLFSPPSSAASTKSAAGLNSSPTRNTALHSLFAPPPGSSASELSHTASPPRTSALHSLFTPPGSSPQSNPTTDSHVKSFTTSTAATATTCTTTKTTTTTPTTSAITTTTSIPKPASTTTRNTSDTIQISHHRTISNFSCGMNMSMSKTSALCIIDIRSTGIPPQAWLQCCQEAATNSSCRLVFSSFSMDGDSWTNQLLQDWANLISPRDLKLLNLATTSGAIGSTNVGITNTKALEGATRLRSLNLNGHNVSDDTTITTA